MVELPGVWDLIKKRDYLKAQSPWEPLVKDGGSELFGYTKDYGRFKLVTIHGVGHSGSVIKFADMYNILNNFMNDMPLAYDFN